MIFKSLFLLTVALTIASCSSTTEPTPVPTVEMTKACRTYDGARGGVQITCIYYDQTDNGRKVGVNDEWIVIESSGTVNTTGWSFNAGDPNQTYPLPASITNRLTIYTHAVPDSVSSTATTLGYAANQWAWNNSEPDTARIINAQGQVVDMFTYRGQ